MTKLTLLIVAAALLFIAHTCCAFKSQEQESCRKQLQRVNLKPCEKHIMERIQGDNDDDDDDNVVLRTLRGRINYNRKEREKEEEGHVQKCCIEMRELNGRTCQCRALQKMMERQSENLDNKEEKQKLEMELMFLPMRCGLGPMIGCDLSPED